MNVYGYVNKMLYNVMCIPLRTIFIPFAVNFRSGECTGWRTELVKAEEKMNHTLQKLN